MSTLREYEITYILDPALDENKRSEINAAIDTKVDEHKGVISTNSDSTRRKLAYSINKQRTGFLRVIQAQLEPATISPLRHDISRMSGVLRLTVIQSAPRADVTASFFDITAKPATPEPAKAAPKKAATKMTDEEVEEKIEEALDEEVK